MYRGKRQMPLRTSKTMAKEVSRKNDAEIISGSVVPFPTPPHFQSPKKIARANKALVLEGMRSRPTKGLKKVSKRTQPGPNLPPEYSPPAHVHPEGERWMKTLQRQNRENSRIFTKKMSKQPRGRKI